MNKIRYINLCIVEFGKRNGMPPTLAFNYLNTYKGFSFLERNYEAEHLGCVLLGTKQNDPAKAFSNKFLHITHFF